MHIIMKFLFFNLIICSLFCTMFAAQTAGEESDQEMSNETEELFMLLYRFRRRTAHNQANSVFLRLVAEDMKIAEEIERLCVAGADVNAIDGNGYSLLHLATSFRCISALMMLDRMGAKILSDGCGWTVLHVAAHEGLTGIITCILSMQAYAMNPIHFLCLKTKCSKSSTAEELAERRGHRKVAASLRDHRTTHEHNKVRPRSKVDLGTKFLELHSRESWGKVQSRSY
jgi:hypothetical protein